MRVSDEKGFTLIELVLTAVVMSVMFAALFDMFATVRITNQRANNLTIATQVAQQQLELFRNTPYNVIAVGTTDISSSLAPYPSLGPAKNANAVVTLVDPNGLKKVEVNINYYDRGKLKKAQVATLVAANGINR